MSFFDEGDEPTRTSTPPRSARPRPRRVPRPRAAAARRAATARRCATRRIAALGVLIVIFVVLVLGVKSAPQRTRAARSRTTTATSARSSRTPTSRSRKPFFELLNSGSTPAPPTSRADQPAPPVAEEDARRARGFDVPGDMKARSRTCCSRSTSARGRSRRSPMPCRAAQARGQPPDGRDRGRPDRRADAGVPRLRRRLLAARRALISEALDDADDQRPDHRRQPVPARRHLARSPTTVAGALGAQRAGGGTGDNSTPAPGLHGHGLTSVAVSGTTLQPSPAINRVPASANLDRSR